MSKPFSSEVPRRRFLARLLGSSLAAAAGGLSASPLLADSRATAHSSDRAASEVTGMLDPSGEAVPPDMSWVERIAAPRRIVFDAAQLDEGSVLHHARVTLANYAEVERTTDADWSMVITIRHHAIPMLANDAMWSKYPFIGKSTELKDAATGKRAARNPFLNANVGKDDKYSLIWPDGGLDTLMRRGVVVLGCGLALRRLAGELAKDTKQDAKVVHTELLANVLPGVYVMPSGVFATVRAQEAGCRLFKSS